MEPAGQIRIDPAREEHELREYLGAEYDHARLQRWEETVEREFEACGDEQAFYRSSRGYLYNLTAFAMSGTKTPYLETLVAHVPVGARLLDYGCGIGSDGLLLLEAGYAVEFADFANPSTEYLRWRLKRRGLRAPIHDIDRTVPSGFDAAYAFDVIEHVERPFDFLGELESRAALVMVNLLEPEPGETELHHELPVPRLLDHACRRRLLAYEVHHGRSHLLLYAIGEPSGLRRWTQRLRVRAAGRRPADVAQ